MVSPVTPPGNISTRVRWIGTNGAQSRLDPDGFGKKSDAQKIDALQQQVDELATYVTELASQLEATRNAFRM